MSDSGGGTGWERLFWLVFDRTSNPVVLLDEERRILDVNSAAATLWGQTREQLLGTSMEDSIRPSERVRAAEEWRDFQDSGEYSGTRDLVRPDGSEMQVEFAAKLATVNGAKTAIYVAMARGEPQMAAAITAAQDLPLSPREREVVTLIALGNDTAEIAQELHISPETVRSHVRNSMTKLGAHTRAQLVAIVLCAQKAMHDGPIERR